MRMLNQSRRNTIIIIDQVLHKQIRGWGTSGVKVIAGGLSKFRENLLDKFQVCYYMEASFMCYVLPLSLLSNMTQIVTICMTYNLSNDIMLVQVFGRL